MRDFQGLKDLSIMLKVKHTPKKHWINSSGWGIVDLLLQSIRNAINVVDFLSMNVDEVTTIDNVFLFTFVLYKIRSESLFWFVWKWLKWRGIIDNVFQLMFRALETFVGASVEVLRCKFISIGIMVTTFSKVQELV